ncbi:hypothetical protein J437_LFUL015192, partial [Ladona fulva]
MHFNAEEWASARNWTAECGMGDTSLLNATGATYPLAGLSSSKPSNFDSPYQYALYIWEILNPGALVRCCSRAYGEEVHFGDVGRVLRVDQTHHDFSVEVDWQDRGSPFWVLAFHIQILEIPPASSPTSLTSPGSSHASGAAAVVPTSERTPTQASGGATKRGVNTQT